MKKGVFNFSIDRQLIDRVRAYAAPSGRSVASVICEAIAEFLKSKGA